MSDAHQQNHSDGAHPFQQLEAAKPLLNVLSEHVVFQDTDHTIVWANKAAVRSVEADVDDLIGKPCYTIWAERGEPCPACPVEKALQAGTPQQGEIQTPDGKAWMVRASPLRDEDGTIIGAVETTLDITERKRVEEQLRESEQRFRTIFENTMVGVYKTTPDGRILQANPALVDMLGYESLVDLRQRNLEAEGFEPSYNRKRFKKEIEQNGVVIGLESSWTRRDGSTLYVRENAKAIRDDNGTVQYYLGTVEDITERVAAEQEIDRLNNTLRLINKIMRHDLINHLNIAESALELYEEEGDISLCEKARSRMIQGMQLIQRMRELESLVGSGGTLRLYDLRDVVEEAVADCPLDYSIEGHGVVLADDALYSVVENIVRNAVEHADADSLDIDIIRNDDTIDLRIADDGRGIPDDLKEKVSEEQYSYGSAGGTGLGLYIVKQTIERYGGSISIQDNEPHGAVVTVSLRAAEKA
ncbi:MAG: PAS domain-containing sensor histidine kinase [Thermoplasmatota archaeon]